MSLAVRLLMEPIRSLAYTGITNVFARVGTSFDHPIRIIEFMNLTDAIMIFSLNGIDDHWILPTLGYRVWDMTANKTINQGYFIAEGSTIYARALAALPATGSVYISSAYGKDS